MKQEQKGLLLAAHLQNLGFQVKPGVRVIGLWVGDQEIDTFLDKNTKNRRKFNGCPLTFVRDENGEMNLVMEPAPNLFDLFSVFGLSLNLVEVCDHLLQPSLCLFQD